MNKNIPTSRSFVYDCIKQFSQGDILSYAHLQSGLERLETSYGLWSYKSIGDVTITLGPPLCAIKDRPMMLKYLLENKKNIILFYLSEDMLKELHTYKFQSVAVGVNRRIHMERFLTQTPSAKVQSALKKAAKKHIQWTEIFDIVSVDDVLSKISTAYLQNAQYPHEMCFVNMPLQSSQAMHRRIFLIKDKTQSIFAFAILNPVYQDGILIGYLLDMLRYQKTKLWGLWYSTVYTLAKILHQESLELFLGFCPLHEISTSNQNTNIKHMISRSMRYQMNLVHRSFQSVQYIKNLREMKEEIEGYNEPIYMSSYTRNIPTCLSVFLKAMGINGQKTVADSMTTQLMWRMLDTGR